MNRKKLAGNLMLAGGIAELLIALLHFVWPSQLIRIGEFANLSTDYKNFLVLGCIAVGLCLIVFGTLSIYYTRGLVAGKKSAWVYGISQGIVWEIRTALELIFPVKIPLLFVTNPSALILPLGFLLGLVFLLPLLIFNKEFIQS
jgi:hypothetical protein